MFNKVDKIFCLTLANAYNRHKEVKEQFKKIGILDKIEFKYCTRHKIDDLIGKQITSVHTDYYDMLYNLGKKNIYGNIYNVTINHFDIIKTSYELGYNYICIFEDDVHFCGDKLWFNNIIKSIPNDFDMLKFKSNYGDRIDIQNKLQNNELNNINNIFELTNDPEDGISAEGYILSKKCMKYIIDELENELVFIDICFKNLIEKYSNELNIYKNTINIIKQNNDESITIS